MNAKIGIMPFLVHSDFVIKTVRQAAVIIDFSSENILFIQIPNAKCCVTHGRTDSEHMAQTGPVGPVILTLNVHDVSH